MADVLRIPVHSSQSLYQFRTVIEDRQYLLRIRWNERMKRWLVDIHDDQEEPILNGIPLNTNIDLISRFKDERLPRGLMLLFDTSEENKEAMREDIGERNVLYYETREVA